MLMKVWPVALVIVALIGGWWFGAASPDNWSPQYAPTEASSEKAGSDPGFLNPGSLRPGQPPVAKTSQQFTSRSGVVINEPTLARPAQSLSDPSATLAKAQEAIATYRAFTTTQSEQRFHTRSPVEAEEAVEALRRYLRENELRRAMVSLQPTIPNAVELLIRIAPPTPVDLQLVQSEVNRLHQNLSPKIQLILNDAGSHMIDDFFFDTHKHLVVFISGLRDGARVRWSQCAEYITGEPMEFGHTNSEGKTTVPPNSPMSGSRLAFPAPKEYRFYHFLR
jgi:hypothetical protein